MKIVDLRAFETVRGNSGVVDSEVDGMCFSQCKREETQECRKGDPNHRVGLDKDGLETSGRLDFIATRYVISARTIQGRNWKNIRRLEGFSSVGQIWDVQVLAGPKVLPAHRFTLVNVEAKEKKLIEFGC